MKKNYFLPIQLITILFFVFNLFPSKVVAQIWTNDSTFNTPDSGPNALFKGAEGTVKLSALQQDNNKIILAGSFNKYNGINANGIVRLNMDGSADSNFRSGTGFDKSPASLIVQPDNRIVLSGDFTTYNDTTTNYIVRLQENGGIDSTFLKGSGFDKSPTCMEIQPDGKIIVAGTFDTYNGDTVKRIIRLNNNGTIDNTFNAFDTTYTRAGKFVLQNDGKIIIAFDGIGGLYLLRLNADGSRDNTYGGLVDVGAFQIPVVECLKIQTDGKLLIAGGLLEGMSPGSFLLTRILPSGEPDTTFNMPFKHRDGWIYTLSLQSDNKIIVGGKDYSTENCSYNLFTRLNEDGSIDNSFNRSGSPLEHISTLSNNGCQTTYTTCIQPDGKIIAGGRFQEINFYNAYSISRINTDGAIDVSFNKTTGVNGNIISSAIQADGKIIIGGYFSAVQYESRSHIARLLEDGTIDNTFNPGTGTNGPVYAITLQPDGKVIIAGEFTQYNNQPLAGLIRLNSNGTLDPSFSVGTGADNLIYSLQLQKDGKLIIGGSFSNVNGVARLNIARLNTDGSLDNGFMSPLLIFKPYERSAVFSSLILPSGKILIGGYFNAFNDKTKREHLIRVNTDGTLDTTFRGIGQRYIRCIAAQTDGKIIAGAGISDPWNLKKPAGSLYRYNENGSIDTTFKKAYGIDDRLNAIRSVTVLPSGKILVGGEFGNLLFDGKTKPYLVLIDSIGQVDTTFNIAPNGPVYTTQLVSSRKVLIAGDFNTFVNIPRNNIARLILPIEIPTNVKKEFSKDSNFSVYPNPTNTSINIENLKVGASMIIRNICGATVYNEQINNSKLTLNVSNYTNGIYFITVTDKDHSFTKRLVVMNR